MSKTSLAPQRRKPISPQVLRQLHEYYGGKRCVVLNEPMSVDWHHLDDDDTNSTFENLVPLSRDFNLNLRDVRDHPDTPLDPRLDPEILLARARLHFAAWEPALAYGAARLAKFIASQYLHWEIERLAGLLSAVLYFVRTRTNYHLIQDVIMRDLMPAATSGRLSARSRGAILRELANLLADHGYANEALQLYCIVDVLQPVNPSDARDLAAFLRRKYMAFGAASGWSHQREAEAAYRDALAMDGGENLKVSVANSRAWTYLDSGDAHRAYETLHPLFVRYRRTVFSPTGAPKPVNVTAWNIAELMHGFAIASFAAKGKAGLALGRQAFRNSTRLFTQCGLRPYVVRSGYLDVDANVRGQYEYLEHEKLPSRGPLPTQLAKLINMLSQKLSEDP